ncbi:MAG: Rieske (2Fe-2S) protein [Lysobacteraceae bacterium]|nr:MAG: Rieske (2Fe-2S) protein [Xanthomonadaceae bacterium]
MEEGVRSSLSSDEERSGVVVARLSEIPDEGLLEVEATIDGVAESLILHRVGAEVRAWLNVCPHAGRRLDWAPGKFLRSKDGLLICAAHGASFELGRGQCVAGPCRGDALRMVAVEVVGEDVVANVTRSLSSDPSGAP